MDNATGSAGLEEAGNAESGSRSDRERVAQRLRAAQRKRRRVAVDEGPAVGNLQVLNVVRDAAVPVRMGEGQRVRALDDERCYVERKVCPGSPVLWAIGCWKRGKELPV